MKLLQWIKTHKTMSITILCTAVFGVPLLIHILFKIQAPVSFLKAEWTAGDILNYYGAVLSFIGTAAITLAAVFLGDYFSKQSEQRQKNRADEERALQRIRQADEREIQAWRLNEQRKQEIQPVFSVEILSLNVQPDGTVDVFNIQDLSSMPKHENIKIRIKNVNKYPIFHVIVFNQYLTQLMEPGGIIELHCTYWNSIDAKKFGNKLIILSDDFDRDDMGRPLWFNINYEDVDGRPMYQGFELRTFDETVYYRRKETHEV